MPYQLASPTSPLSGRRQPQMYPNAGFSGDDDLMRQSAATRRETEGMTLMGNSAPSYPTLRQTNTGMAPRGPSSAYYGPTGRGTQERALRAYGGALNAERPASPTVDLSRPSFIESPALAGGRRDFNYSAPMAPTQATMNARANFADISRMRGDMIMAPGTGTNTYSSDRQIQGAVANAAPGMLAAQTGLVNAQAGATTAGGGVTAQQSAQFKAMADAAERRAAQAEARATELDKKLADLTARFAAMSQNKPAAVAAPSSRPQPLLNMTEAEGDALALGNMNPEGLQAWKQGKYGSPTTRESGATQPSGTGQSTGGGLETGAEIENSARVHGLTPNGDGTYSKGDARYRRVQGGWQLQ